MVLIVLRGLFVLLMGAVGFFVAFQTPRGIIESDIDVWILPVIAIVFGVLVMSADILSPRKKLAILSGSFLGLVVGLLIAYVLSFIVRLMIEQYATGDKERLIQYINMMITVAACYLSMSFILQTKDDFRFIIPYVEFAKQTKGARPFLIDTSVLIDGRIADVAVTGIIDSQLIVPQFVIDELQYIADGADKLKRNRGKRGLDVLRKLRENPKIDVTLYDAMRDNSDMGADHKLVVLAKEVQARLLTNDMNLNKVAQLRGVDVVNLNDLANAMKPEVLPGERMTVLLKKPGEGPGQGVGYLDDGTMVVVEQGRNHINEEVEFTVTNTRQTSAGKMIFGRMNGSGPPAQARTH